MPNLRLVSGGSKSKIFYIHKQITAIGASPENDIVIKDMGLENHHARIIFDGRKFMLVSLGQAPIFINGKKKKKHYLSHEERICLAQAELIFSFYEEVPEQDEAILKQELRAYHRLHRFSERLMVKHSLSELLNTLMDAVIEITQADKGFLILMEDQKPVVKVARNIHKQEISQGESQFSDSIVNKVLQTKEPLIISDALSDEEFKSSESVVNFKLCSVMCVPLKYKGKLLGLIYLGNDNIANLFDVRTLEVLTVFASQASLMIQNALLIDELRLDRDQLLKEIKHIRFGEMIGSCPSMLEVFNMVRKVAPSDVSVLITGETGTGKELIARQIHRLSSRAKGPFVALNCGAIPENLIESELFGHERGAFTGAVTTKLGKFHLANHGTIFLDEIGELSPALQVKLLRVLQEKAVMKVGSTKSEYLDIRVIAATNKDLKQEIKKGRFREDLFWRLNVITISLPPLRDRGDDVIVIAKYLLEKYAKEYNKKTKGFTKEAISAIKKFHWPGNIRELENRIKKAIILGEKNFIEAEDLELPSEDSSPLLPLHQAKEAFQRRYILEALRRNQGNRTKTAMDLGVDPRTIFRYLEKVPNEK